MTTDEKLMALKALTPTHLEMRAPGDWYVRAYAREVEERSMLAGRYGNGATPHDAIEDDWRQIATGEIIRTNGKGRVRWNGYMWEDVP